MRGHWKKYYTRPTRTQDFDIFVVKPFFKLFPKIIKHCLYLPHQGKWEGWYIKEEFNGAMEKIGREVFQQKWTWQKHFQDFKKAARDVERASLNLNHHGPQANYPRLLNEYIQLLQAHCRYSRFIWQPWSINIFLENWLVQHLKEKFADWQQIYETLALSAKPTRTQQMVEAVWRWKINGGGEKQLQKIIDKYAFLGGYSVNDKFWNKKEILSQAAPLINCAKKLKQVQQARIAHRQKVKKTLARVASQDKLLAKVARIIHEYTWLRTERVDVYKYSMMFVQPFYRRLEKDFGWPFGWAAHLTYAEIIDFLKGRRPVSYQELRNRDRLQYLVYFTPKKTIVISDSRERTKFLQRLGVQKQTATETLRGQSACRGKVRGRVRVILQARDASQLQKGEILVANMTHPDYMAGIRKAAALVTDEGGIVCHAAIISRELKIPCVIGTNNATKIFKTGDLVEVNANNGVVKKI